MVKKMTLLFFVVHAEMVELFWPPVVKKNKRKLKETKI